MDEKDVLQQAEEILHVIHHPDATVYVVETVQPPIVDSSPTGIAQVPPAMPVLLTVLVALLLPLASILFQLHMLLSPPIATILVKAQQLTSLAHVYTLPPVTITQSQIVTTTGHGHIPATQAHGTITFYNASTQQQIVDAGTLLVGRDEEQIITDETAYIPAGNLTSNGTVSVWAHAVDYGPAGNISANDVYGACCRLLVQAVNNQFTGGHNAKDYPLVTKGDIATATSNLLAQVQAEFSLHHENLSAGETLVTPVPCTTHTASNHRAGDEAAQVTVTVNQSCSPSAYKPSDVQHSLIALVAGKTKQDAFSTLLRLPGVTSVAISWADDIKLPPAMYIHLDILVSG